MSDTHSTTKIGIGMPHVISCLTPGSLFDRAAMGLLSGGERLAPASSPLLAGIVGNRLDQLLLAPLSLPGNAQELPVFSGCEKVDGDHRLRWT